MNLREAAQQALEALELWGDCLTDPSAQPGWRFSVVGEKAIANLRDALYEDSMQRFTEVQQKMQAAFAPVTCNGLPAIEGPLSAMQRLTDVQQEMESAVKDQATYGMSITLGGKRIDPASIYKQEVPQDHIPDANKMVDVQQEMDCYGDGNVYRGQRSKDSKTQTLTFSKMETVEPVAWMRVDRGHVDFHRHPDYLPLYTAPPGIVSRAVDAERERIAAWVEDMCAGLDAKTIANWIRNGGNDDIRAFEVRK